MFFSDPFYTSNFSPRYSTMSQYADRVCNCPECHATTASRRPQQTRRNPPARAQIRDFGQRGLFQNPFFEENSRPARKAREEPRLTKKKSKKPKTESQAHAPKSPTHQEKMQKTPKKPVEIPIKIVNPRSPDLQQREQEIVGDRKILSNLENLVIEELSTPVEIKEDPFHADEEIEIPSQ